MQLDIGAHQWSPTAACPQLTSANCQYAYISDKGKGWNEGLHMHHRGADHGSRASPRNGSWTSGGRLAGRTAQPLLALAEGSRVHRCSCPCAPPLRTNRSQDTGARCRRCMGGARAGLGVNAARASGRGAWRSYRREGARISKSNVLYRRGRRGWRECVRGACMVEVRIVDSKHCSAVGVR